MAFLFDRVSGGLRYLIETWFGLLYKISYRNKSFGRVGVYCTVTPVIVSVSNAVRLEDGGDRLRRFFVVLVFVPLGILIGWLER